MRRTGILLHPTSLPGPYGLGEIGPSARTFLRWLDAAGCTVWQMLPLGPIDEGGSPYSAPSAFARNTQLLSIDDLVDDGWLRPHERPFWNGNPHRVDFSQVIAHRAPALALAGARVAAEVDLDEWSASRSWSATWALYAALSDEHGPEWTKWPVALRDRDAKALGDARDRLARPIRRELALQWLFEQQWERLRAEARRRGVELWGDVPIFVGGESCETWESRHLFRLDEDGRPTVVSGVPPDAFSADGQLWGHPLYDEAAMKADGYQWWSDRMAAALELVDTVRIDHFRGVAAYWEIPLGQPATEGTWIPGPGQAMLDVLKARFGKLPFVAEDLGIITPDVEALRDDNDLPGMAILQFAFNQAGIDHTYLPHHHRARQVVFPGTHDNDTCVGWYESVDERARDHARRYFLTSGHDIAWDFIHAALRSPAETAIVQMQDVLSLDGRARTNVPGQIRGNWGWRMVDEALHLGLAQRLRDQNLVSGRLRADARR